MIFFCMKLRNKAFQNCNETGKKNQISKKSNTFSLVKSAIIYLPSLECETGTDHFRVDINFLLNETTKHFAAGSLTSNKQAEHRYFAHSSTPWNFVYMP